jgi:hypothetical protein
MNPARAFIGYLLSIEAAWMIDNAPDEVLRDIERVVFWWHMHVDDAGDVRAFALMLGLPVWYETFEETEEMMRRWAMARYRLVPKP